MTPKEKATSIYNQYYILLLEADSDVSEEVLISILAKKCAILSVKEVIEQWEVIDVYLADGRGELNPNLKYWYEVREELNKL